MKATVRIIGIIILLVMGGERLGAQQAVKVEEIKPDCTIYFTLTVASPNSVSYDNRSTGCMTWTLSYLSNGFTGLSLTVQQAPDNVGVPGAWAAFAGSVLGGINPNTALTFAGTTLYGYVPWIRANLGGLVGVGTVTGRLYGYRLKSLVFSSIVGGAGPGGSVFGYLGCNLSRTITLVGAGSTEIIPLSGTKVIRICHVSYSTTAAEDIKLVQGTGANCAGGPADMTGLYKSVQALALDLFGTLVSGAGQAVCLNQSAAQTGGGVVTYAQY